MQSDYDALIKQQQLPTDIDAKLTQMTPGVAKLADCSARDESCTVIGRENQSSAAPTNQNAVTSLDHLKSGDMRIVNMALTGIEK